MQRCVLARDFTDDDPQASASAGSASLRLSRFLLIIIRLAKRKFGDILTQNTRASRNFALAAAAHVFGVRFRILVLGGHKGDRERALHIQSVLVFSG